MERKTIKTAKSCLFSFCTHGELCSPRSDYIRPVISNAKYNEYLKEIAKILGIEKRVTSHLARHTFATTVTYANGVSIETISKMLGHTKLSTTQIYARIVDQTVSREMDKLSETLSGTSFSLNGGDGSSEEAAASTESAATMDLTTSTNSSASASSTPNI
ncbi:MAG: integrase catalytic domain-containing protein [Alistipes sp.]|nr:integrase catalytic domain-containing protein [Alistipes sp.]